jgi:hypothetical protein
MIPLWQIVAVLVELVRWWSTPPVSLADAASHEAFRREMVGKSVAAFTNATLPELETPAAGPPDTTVPPDAVGEPDESSWRRRVQELREAIEENRRAIAAAEGRLALLESQAVSRDDPAQQAVLRQQAREALEALTELRRKVVAGEQALSLLLEEARRLGIPPGWLRP